jgi:RNA polymerase-binding transcription factor
MMRKAQKTKPICAAASGNLDQRVFWGSASAYLPAQAFIESEPDADPLDQATNCAQSFNENALENFRLGQYEQAVHALERARQGLAGICEDCKKPIPGARLVARPDATRCIDCQRIFENRSHPAGD